MLSDILKRIAQWTEIMTVFLNVIGSVQIKICDILMEIKILETKMKRAWKM